MTETHSSRITRKLAKWISLFAAGAPLFWFAANGTFSFEYQSSADGLNSGMSGGDPQGRTFENVIILAILSLFLLSKPKALTSAIIKMPALLFAPALAILSALWSQEPMISAGNGIRMLFAVLFALHLTLRFSTRDLMVLLIAVGSVFGLLNITVSLGFPHYGVEPKYSEYAWRGITAFKNVCGYSTVFLISPALFLHLHSRMNKLILYIYILAQSGVVFFTKSRTAWIMLVALLLVRYFVGLSSRFQWKQYIVFLFIGISVASVGLFLGRPLLSLAAQFLGKDASLNGRTDIWLTISNSLIKKPLLGYGYHAFWLGLNGESGLIMTTGGWYPGFAHNGFLEIWLELGLVGVLAATLPILHSLRVGLSSMRLGYSAKNSWYLSIVILTIICNITEGTLLSAANLAWLMFVMAWVTLTTHYNLTPLAFKTGQTGHYNDAEPLQAHAVLR